MTMGVTDVKKFLLTALKLGVKSSRKGNKQPTKSTMKARWDIPMEQPPTLERYERIVKLLTLFYGGFGEERWNELIPHVQDIMMTDPSPVMKSCEYYLKILKI